MDRPPDRRTVPDLDKAIEPVPVPGQAMRG